MTTTIRHHKMIVSDPLESTIHRTGISPHVYSKKIKLFDDPYFQQLWLNQLVKHKETFIEIANHLGDLFYIPICSAHELVEPEQANLYKMIKKLECDEITFNFFASSFQNFQYKNKDLKEILKKSKNIKLVGDDTYQRIYTNPSKIKLHNLAETIRKIEQESHDDEKPFQAPIELIRHNQILNQLKYKINDKKLTVKAYNIIQNILHENIDLLNEFFEDEENKYVSYENRPQYDTLCEQYGNAEINYLINEYLRG